MCLTLPVDDHYWREKKLLKNYYWKKKTPLLKKTRKKNWRWLSPSLKGKTKSKSVTDKLILQPDWSCFLNYSLNLCSNVLEKKTVKLLPPKWLSIPPSSVASCSFLVKNAQTFKRWHRVGLGHRHRTRTSRDQSVAMSETRYRSPLQFYIANFCRFWHRQRAIPKPNVMQRLTRMEFKAKTSVKLLLIKY